MTAATPTMGRKPRITLMTLGGTIASLGSSAAATTIYALDPNRNPVLDAVAGLANIADVRVETVAHLSSHDIPLPMILQLARRIRTLFDEDAADGIVVTHGTDTLEETAFLLDLLLPPGRSVVATGAMRPASALGADGPRNLYAAVRVACEAQSAGRGVLVCLNDRIGAATTTIKGHTSAVDAFLAAEAGYLGSLAGDAVTFFAPPCPQHMIRFDAGADNDLPRVDIVYSHLGMDAAMAFAALDAGAAGLVIAGTGNGSIADTLHPAIIRARDAGIPVVRASRVSAGRVTTIAIDAELATIPSGALNPQKARLLLMLALRDKQDRERIRAMFATF